MCLLLLGPLLGQGLALGQASTDWQWLDELACGDHDARSEERRGGKECRYGWWADD